MKQVLQNLGSGEIELADVLVPAAEGEQILIKTRYAVVLSGTVRTLVEFGRSGWFERRASNRASSARH
jgi:hypothetical protein